MPVSLSCRFHRNHSTSISGATIVVELDNLLTSLASSTLSSGAVITPEDGKTDLAAKRDYLRILLSAFLTYGLNEDIDRVCHEKLGLHKLTPIIGSYR